MAVRGKCRSDRDAIASLLRRLSCDAREFSFGGAGDSDSDDDAGDVRDGNNRATAVPRIAISPEAARSYARTEASASNAYGTTASTSSDTTTEPPIVLSPLEFHRDFIAANRPCVITGAVSHWPALSLWRSDQYLIDALGDKKVTVDFTPDGHGDAIVWRDGIGRSDHGRQLEGETHEGSGSGFRGDGGGNSGCDCTLGDNKEGCDYERGGNEGVRRWVMFPGDEGWDGREGRESSETGEEGKEEEEGEEEGDGKGESKPRGGKSMESEEVEGGRAEEGGGAEEGANCNGCCARSCNSRCNGCCCCSTPRACSCDPPYAWFVTPHEASLTLPAFLRLLYSSRSSPSDSPSHSPSHSPLSPSHSRSPRTSSHSPLSSSHASHSPFVGVPYVQHQNGSFRTEFAALAADADEHVGFATAALGGNLPEAVNLWIGDERAVTSWHKDHYENFYVVVTGRKTFRLLPPLDVFRMRVREYPTAKYWRAEDEQGPFHIVPSDPPSTVPWVSVDAGLNPLMPCRHAVGTGEGQDADERKAPPPLVCTIGPGEMLYLPSMWYHHVSQSPDETGRTIALNYWYDMQFDVKYAYFNLVQSLTRMYQL